MLINIKTSRFHSSINHQEQLFHRTLITGFFRSVNIAKFLRTAFIIKHLQKQSFADIPQNSYSWKFFELHRKAIVLESLFKKLQDEGLQLHKIRLQHRCLRNTGVSEVCKIFKNSFSYRTPPVNASAPPVAASVVFLKSAS